MGRLGVVVLFGAALGSGCSDSRCNPANCAWYLNTCHGTLPDQPDKTFSFCTPAGNPPSNFDFNQYCPGACNQAHAGKLLQCLTTHPECGDQVDGGAGSALAACGGVATRSPQPGCLEGCNTTRESCDQTCQVRGSFQACADCVASCGLNWQSCVDACPTQ